MLFLAKNSVLCLSSSAGACLGVLTDCFDDSEEGDLAANFRRLFFPLCLAASVAALGMVVCRRCCQESFKTDL